MKHIKHWQRKVTQEAKSIAEICKRTEKASEKTEELEEYMKVQDETFVDFPTKVETARVDLDTKYKALEEKYEQK